MNIEKAYQLFNELEEDSFTQNLIAQANAKNILLESNESFENFPNFTEGLDEKINHIAFSYLSIACNLKENGIYDEVTLKSFEKVGDIIHSIHAPQNNRKANSSYYLLISSLSLYISTQYSKSFIVIKKAEPNTIFTQLIGLFLKKDLNGLVVKINEVLLNETFFDSQISQLDDELEENYRFYTVILAKSLNLIMEYAYTGELKWLDLAQEYIYDLKELASIDDEPSSWWISRLLLILLDTYRQYSFWNILPNIINNEKVNLYIQQLSFNNPSIIELFYTQYQAIEAMQNNQNIVISLPTSSGKTRIAEIAILQTLSEYPQAKVLYLAPFRSLSFEIEESMDKVFGSLGYKTTFLYGGGQFSNIDKTLIEHSNIIIATPEKAKAIIRADERIANEIKLLVIDEGHLVGANKRFIQNELFTEELKFHINKNDGKIILLSAVLPNTKDISKWISNSENNVFESTKKLSNQRFGILKWTRSETIDIEWIGESNSFNKNFVENPDSKFDGFASTAFKLSSFGAVLFFVAQATQVLSNARRVLKAMGDNKQKINFKNQYLFHSLDLACKESGENEIFKLAEYGIICHNGQLAVEVRLFLEKIMREEQVKVIVATTTLGQGVNIGISTVIFADVFRFNSQRNKREEINSKDFWNIAGRAGRAFVDIEGKILFGIDENKKQWSLNKDFQIMNNFFDVSKMEIAQSGLLSLIKEIKNIAIQCGIDFNLLLQLITENNFSKLKTNQKDYSQDILEAFNWIDDTLLALDYKKESFLYSDPSQWIDDSFRNSLAYIQAEQEDSITQEEIIQFLKARNRAVINIAGNSTNWESIIKSGIPLNSSMLIDEFIEDIKSMINDFIQSQQGVNEIIELLKNIEEIIKKMPSTSFKHNFNESEIEQVRQQWVSGMALSQITKVNKKNGQKICVEYFGMTVPWAMNAIVRKLEDLELEVEKDIIESLALSCELGLPNLSAVNIYLSGIKSRVTALDLSRIFQIENVEKGQLLRFINQYSNEIELGCLEMTKEWIKLFILQDSNTNTIEEIPFINDFTLETESKSLTVRTYENKLYLCSPEFKTKIAVGSTHEFPFEEVANNLSINFQFNDGSWSMNNRNPKNIIDYGEF